MPVRPQGCYNTPTQLTKQGYLTVNHPMHFPFYKFQGLGNDFIILKVNDLPYDTDLTELAQRLCDRHFGIGADGLLLHHADTEADATMQVINSDGSEPEICGNGLRCFVSYLYQVAGLRQREFRIQTGAGLLDVSYAPERHCARVNMGSPRLLPEQIPAQGWSAHPVLCQALQVEDRSFEVTLVSLGNPHCVINTGPDWSEAETQYWGPRIENHPAFPQRINIEFVHVESPQQARVSVWERGAGATLACGTGACATLVAGVLNGWLETDARITLPGGNLNISWDREQNLVWMEGPAHWVFSGHYQEEGMET